jgi:hypothetical protein
MCFGSGYSNGADSGAYVGPSNNPNQPNLVDSTPLNLNKPNGVVDRGFAPPMQPSLSNTPPAATDLTDELLQKTRTNFALRLMAGRNQRSSFGGTQLGGLDLSKNRLGSY